MMNKTKLNYKVVLKKDDEVETPKNFATKQSILNNALSQKVSGIQNPSSQTGGIEPVKHQ